METKQTHGNNDDNEENKLRTTFSSYHPERAQNSSSSSLHPLQVEHQQQPWLIPHPSLPISWRNNDNAQHHHHAGSKRTGESSQSLQRFEETRALSRPDSSDAQRALDWQRPQDERGIIPSILTDQGHESDPSDLMRPPIFLDRPRPDGSDSLRSQHELDMYPLRRPNRSLSLSVSPDPWSGEQGMSLPSSLPSAWTHREVVPYSQEWRVILRSSPRGRTVMYNPQMQSLVVQTTVGLDSHPMARRMDDSGVCSLCRRPFDLEETVEEEAAASNGSSFMDTNYFRMLADANIALSRRASLQADPGVHFGTHSPIGSPSSSSRASLDLDSTPHVRDDQRNNKQENQRSPHLSHDALNQGYYQRFFVEQVKLGRGYRGSVFLCQHILDGVHLGEYAIKKVAVGDNHDWLVQMLREVHLLERLHHPNIVSYKHAWLENHQLHQFSPEVTCLFILMECANGGNLEEYIEHSAGAQVPLEPESNASKETAPKKVMTAQERLQSKRQQLQNSILSPPSKQGEGSGSSGKKAAPQHYLSITEIWSFFFDICEGLAHLHRLGIIHRDLKPPNLLLSYSNSQVKGSKGERPRILITDFGECEVLDQASKRDRTGATGTLEFLAPELLAVDSEGRYTDEFSFKGDMWSLGMVLYYLCYSKLPYTQIDDVDGLKEEIREFRTVTIPEDGPEDRIIPEELKILIRVLLSIEKSKRPSCDDILSTLSHQRDRMMHGEMDKPTSSGRTKSFEQSLNVSSVSIESEEVMGGGLTPLKDREMSVSPPQRQPQTMSSGRKNVHSSLAATPSVSTERRRSRSHALSDLAKSSPSGSASTNPGLNAHRKIKPLGLGLNLLRRRRMNHHLGAGAMRHPIHAGREGTSSRKNSQENALRMSFPSPLSGSVVRSPRTRASPAMSLTEQFQQQHDYLQSRKEIAASRESTLAISHPVSGSADRVPMNIPSSNEEGNGQGADRKGKQSRRLSEQHQAQVEETLRTSPRKHSRHTAMMTRGQPQRESFSSESTDSSQDEITRRLSPLKINRSHWKNLATHHARQASSEAQTEDGKSQAKASTLSERHSRQWSRDSRSKPLRKQQQQQELEMSPRQPHPLTHVLEQFGAYATVISLLIRVWVCMSICNPVMVRPMVLYPVLILTAIWDRYLLSLVAEYISGSPSPSSLKGSGHGSSLKEERTKHLLAARVEDEHVHESLLLKQQKSETEASLGEGTADGEGEEGEGYDRTTEYNGSDAGGSSRIQHRGVGGQQMGASIRTATDGHLQKNVIGQALVGGVVLQLLWVAVVRVLSRGGLCML